MDGSLVMTALILYLSLQHLFENLREFTERHAMNVRFSTSGFRSLLVSLSFYNVREQVQIPTCEGHEQHEYGWKFVPLFSHCNYL